MPLYQIKIVMKKYKIDEFVDSMRSLLPEFRKENGCLDCCMYQDFDEEHAFCIVADWETHEAIQKHFRTQKFEVLIGAARVLGERFEMMMAEVSESGGIELPAKIAAYNTTN
jgi:quinol monooxygenase YgiN